jgi:hypothetical protein
MSESDDDIEFPTDVPDMSVVVDDQHTTTATVDGASKSTPSFPAAPPSNDLTEFPDAPPDIADDDGDDDDAFPIPPSDEIAFPKPPCDDPLLGSDAVDADLSVEQLEARLKSINPNSSFTSKQRTIPLSSKPETAEDILQRYAEIAKVCLCSAFDFC